MDYTDRLGYRETGGNADLAQLVEHSIRNAGVISSNLIVGTTLPPDIFPHGGRCFPREVIKVGPFRVLGVICLRVLREIVID